MDLSLVKTLIIKEGRVKKILKGDTVIWNKIPFSVEITNDTAQTITGFKYMLDGSFTFAVNYHVPKIEQNATPTWTISGLPEGLTAEDLNANNLTVSGCTEHSGDHTVTVSVTKGNYNDTKTYMLNVDYGILITTPNKSPITDFALNEQGSKTFESKFNVPEEEQDSPVEWSFENLPDGLSAEGATVSGTATSPSTCAVTVTVRKGSYSDTKTFTFAVYGLVITNTSLPNGMKGFSYSAPSFGVIQDVPSDAGALSWSFSNLPSGLIQYGYTSFKGVPEVAETRDVFITATRYPYCATKTLPLTIQPTPTVTCDASCNITFLTNQLKSSDMRGELLQLYPSMKTEIYINGTNLQYAGLWAMSNLIFTSNTATQPEIQINASIVSNTQIKLTFTLIKQAPSTTTAATIAKRTKTDYLTLYVGEWQRGGYIVSTLLNFSAIRF